MRHRVLTSAVLCSIMLVGASRPAFAAESPDESDIPLIAGGSVSIAGFAGSKPVLLKFWATWCVACIEQMPEYRALYAEFGDSLEFIAVNVAVSDPPERVRRAVDEHDLKMPVAYDSSGTLWNAFDVYGTPTYVLIDQSGETVYSGFQHDEEFMRALSSVTRSRVSNDDDETASASGPLLDIDGEPLDLMYDSPGPVLVYHFATWCESYVEQTYPELAGRCRDFRESLARIGDVAIVGFATRYSSREEGVRRYRERFDIRHRLMFDENGAFAVLSGVRDFPYLIVLRDGKIVHRSDRIDADVLAALGESR